MSNGSPDGVSATFYDKPFIQFEKNNVVMRETNQIKLKTKC